jgi:hypothetical protein
MSFFARSLLLLVLFRVSAPAAGLMTFAGECRMPVVDGWEVLSDSGGYPIELLHQSYEADFSIFRSSFGIGEAVTTAEELRAAVDGVLDKVIGELPGSRLLTNTGYYHAASAGFILEFESTDPDASLPIRHRMYTALYTLPEGDQVMFTLWAKATESDYLLAEPSIRYMQEQFAFTGAHRANFFPPTSLSRWRWMALFLGLVIVIWLVRRQWVRRTDRQSGA